MQFVPENSPHFGHFEVIKTIFWLTNLLTLTFSYIYEADLLFTINDKRTQTQAILDKLHRLSKYAIC